MLVVTVLLGCASTPAQEQADYERRLAALELGKARLGCQEEASAVADQTDGVGGELHQEFIEMLESPETREIFNSLDDAQFLEQLEFLKSLESSYPFWKRNTYFKRCMWAKGLPDGGGIISDDLMAFLRRCVKDYGGIKACQEALPEAYDAYYRDRRPDAP